MLRTRLLACVFMTGLSACAPFRLAPGADQVRVTNRGADVAGCAPVGNLKIPEGQASLFGNQLDIFKNQAIGFGGNAAFVTQGTLRYPEAGVAYQCPKAGA